MKKVFSFFIFVSSFFLSFGQTGNLVTNVGAVAFVSGTYTPTVTSTANIQSASATECQYIRVGNVVTMSGSFSIDPISASTTTSIELSLPIASNFDNISNLGGVARTTFFCEQTAFLSAQTTTDRIDVDFISSASCVLISVYTFSLTYKII